MAGLDPVTFFDGNTTQGELETASSEEERATYISLIAEAKDGFVVVSGSDIGWGTSFNDADIASIFLVFAETVDAYPGADASTIRMAAGAALAGMWHPSTYVGASPFDEKLPAKTRLIFHVYSQGWGFEPARIKFKSVVPDGGFTGLDWLTLNGVTTAPYSFKIDVNTEAVSADAYEFALYVKASQDAGNQETRLIIDPKIEVTQPPT